jgi:hypothetical protein
MQLNFYSTAEQSQHLLSPIYITEADIFNLIDLYVIAKISDGNNVLISAQMMHGWEWEIRDFPNTLEITLDKVVKMVKLYKIKMSSRIFCELCYDKDSSI